jgi:hypothetical protein
MTTLDILRFLFVLDWFSDDYCRASSYQGLNSITAITAIAVEGEQNAVDHCSNDSNFWPYSVIFILFTVHYYFDT